MDQPKDQTLERFSIELICSRNRRIKFANNGRTRIDEPNIEILRSNRACKSSLQIQNVVIISVCCPQHPKMGNRLPVGNCTAESLPAVGSFKSAHDSGTIRRRNLAWVRHNSGFLMSGCMGTRGRERTNTQKRSESLMMNRANAPLFYAFSAHSLWYDN